MARKPKQVEIVLRVNVPAHWSIRHARHEIADAWYGQIHAVGPNGFGDDVVLRPRWGRARAAARIRVGERSRG